MRFRSQAVGRTARAATMAKSLFATRRTPSRLTQAFGKREDRLSPINIKNSTLAP